MEEKETQATENEDFEVTELDDGDLGDVAGGLREDSLLDDNSNCGCINSPCRDAGEG